MNRMPVVHHARRTVANHREGNPFADRAHVERVLREVEEAYLDPRTNDRVSKLLHVEADRLAGLLAGEG